MSAQPEDSASGGPKPPARSGPERPPTIYDVARAAGVSHQTVHRFLNGYQGIRPHTRERVATAVAELAYRPNLTARSLTTGRSHRLGVLTHEIAQVGPNQTLQGAIVAARAAGYLLDVVTLDMSDDDSINEALDLVMKTDLAGILALASTDEMTAAFERTDFRVPAFIAGEDDDAFSGQAMNLTSRGVPDLIAHLAELGHQRVLLLTGPSGWSAARNRTEAFRRAVDSHGLEVTQTLTGDWSARSGFDLISGLRSVPATTIVAANDQMALGAMLALHDRGLSVPGDVSVSGIDDIPEAAYFISPLTTIRLDFAAHGRVAVWELLARLNHGTPPTTHLDAELMVRRSTGPARS